MMGACSGLPGADERAVWRRLDLALEQTRPTQGRLSNRSYSPHIAPASGTQHLAEAELLLQRIRPDSGSRDRLASYVSMYRGAWEDAASQLQRALDRTPDDALLTNDLGVIYLERAVTDPAFLLDAFRQFSAAVGLDPSLHEPRYNLVLTYKALHLSEARQEAEAAYRRIDINPASPWLAELTQATPEPTKQAFREALTDGNLPLSAEFVAANPDLFWQVVTDYALRRPQAGLPQPNVLLELAYQVERTTGDATPRLILEPLSGPEGEQVRMLRQLVVTTLASLRTGGFADALNRLDGAHGEASALGSEFDRLWFALNLAETLAWSGQVSEADGLLTNVITRARQLNLKWVLADALTRYSDQRYVDSRATLLERLGEALRTYDEVGAITNSIRPRLALAVHAMREGSSREAFRLGQEALDLSDPDDAVGRRNLIWILSQNGQLDQALERAYLTEAAFLSLASGALDGVAEAEMRLAEHHIALGEATAADQHLEAAGEATSGLAAEVRNYITLSNTITSSRILQQRSAYDEAEAVLLEGLRLLPAEPTGYQSMFHLELAAIYVNGRRDAEARERFELGLAALEREDDFLGARSRLSFDERRRAGYEDAIRFEYSRGETDAAWRTVQRYRNKLWKDAFDRKEGGQVVSVASASRPPLQEGVLLEFTVLEEAVLLWVIRNGRVDVTDVLVSREDLEVQVEEFGRLLREDSAIENLGHVSRDLYDKLIAPVEHLLEGATWIAVVPDRMLHYLPFGALVDGEGRYLIERVDLVTTPERDYFLAPAVPMELQNQIVFGSRNGDRGTATEIAGINDLYPDAMILDGYDVTRNAFLENMTDADLLVYAGHSAMDSTGALTSALLLDEAADRGNSVTALEIARQSLGPNALVVLSSCDSAVGNAVGGVEYRGLTSAFLVAGAGSVVGSLWPVETLETAHLMLDFHTQLTEHMPIATALATSQRKMIAEDKHPFYWAAFTVTGNQSTLRASMPANQNLPLVATSALSDVTLMR